MEQENRKETVLDKDILITFQEGIFGFEDYTEFVPLLVEENNDGMLYLQNTKEEQLCFLVMNPFLLKEDYAPVLSEEDRKALKVKDDGDLAYYVMCVTKDIPEESTVNLKCPIVINVPAREARQVILETDEYGLRHQLREFSDKEGTSC